MRDEPPRPDPRRAAFEILERVDQSGAWASALLEIAEARFEDDRDASLVHEIVLGVLRRRSLLDHAISEASSRALLRLSSPVRTALRIGAYSILFLDRVPHFAAVDTAVELVKTGPDRSRAGFVNAVLRRIAAGGRTLAAPQPPAGDVVALALFQSHPPWWVARIVDRLGWHRAVRLLEANNQPAPTVIRPNLRRTTRNELARQLQAQGVGTEPCSFVPEALRVTRGVPQRTACLGDGLFWIQDESSQLVPRLLGAVLGPRVLDVCAAPGSKSLQLSERVPVGGIVVASDRHGHRLTRLVRSLRRLGIDTVRPIVADMSRQPPLAGLFDHVLVDAPCSGTGTMRRRPEIRWRIRPEDLRVLAERQARLVENAANLVAPGGILVYSVCSLEPEEGEGVVESFLSHERGFRIDDPRPAFPPAARELITSEGFLRTSPDVGGLDGFFAARFVKNLGS